MSASIWEQERNSSNSETLSQSSDVAHNLIGLRDAAITLLREVESLTNANKPRTERRLALHEEVQRYEIGLIRGALKRTRGNQRRAAKLLGVKVSTLNCKIKRFGIELSESESDLALLT